MRRFVWLSVLCLCALSVGAATVPADQVLMTTGSGNTATPRDAATVRNKIGADNASNLSSGTIPDARLSTNVPVMTAGVLPAVNGSLLTSVTAASATNATNAANVAITDDTSTNTTMYLIWANACSGNVAVKGSSSKLTFNPSTGLLTASGFSGPLTGNVTGNVSGSSGSCTGNSATATTATTANALANADSTGQSAITAINSATSGTINAARIATLNQSTTGAAGSITNTDAGGQSLITAINSATSGTIGGARIDTGTAEGKIVVLGSGGKLPAVDGSQLTNIASGSNPNGLDIFDDCMGPLILWGANITVNGAATDKTIAGTAARPGLYAMNINTTASGCAGFSLSGSTANKFILFGGGAWTFECAVKLSALSDVTDRYEVRLGFGNQATASAFTNGVYFDYTDTVNSGQWTGVAVDNSTPTTVNSSVAASIADFHTFKIVVNAAGSSAEFFIDGTSIGTAASNIPTTAGREVSIYAMISRTAGSTNNRTLTIDWGRLRFTPTAAR